MDSTIKVCLVEDDDELRETLQCYLQTPGFQCLQAFASAEAALANAGQLAPDVFLVDIHLGGMSGIECISQLRRLLPATKCVVLTSFERADLVFQALAAGAFSYLVKGLHPTDLLQAVREVHQGGSNMSSQLAHEVISFFRRHPEPASPADQLTERESQVLKCLSRGLAYKQVAADLGISMSTTRTHIQRIYHKLHVHNRTEALRKNPVAVSD